MTISRMRAIWLIGGLLAVGAWMSGVRAAEPGAVEGLADDLVANFRRLLLAHESEPGRMARAKAGAGQQLFFENRRRAERLVALTLGDATACAGLMDHLQGRAQWRDVDRLALGGVMAELDARLPADSPCLSRVRVERGTLARIRADYNRELSAAMKSAAPSVQGRPEWNDYIAFLKRRGVQGIDAGPESAPAAADAVRPAAVTNALREEWTDGGLPPRTVLLTFDDGPHPVYTPRILDILKRHGVRAVFFQIGQNIAAVRAGSAAVREPALIRRMLDEGHSIANHTLTHPLLPRLTEVQVAEEIDRTEAYLALAAGTHPGRVFLFRPPYGARNDLVLSDVSQRGLRSVIWNIDSRDWADPIPESIARRVLEEAEREGRGIVLFHDIHLRSVEALEPTIEGLKRSGFRFARLAGGTLVTDP